MAVCSLALCARTVRIRSTWSILSRRFEVPVEAVVGLSSKGLRDFTTAGIGRGGGLSVHGMGRTG